MLKEFDKIIGYNDIKAELERICDILINPEKYKKLGVNLPNGLLLYGGPGVGKTTMAFCFAEATKRKVFVCRKDMPDDDFVREIKKTFDKAIENTPSIVFLDDLDRYSNEDPLHKNTNELVTVQACIDGCKGKDVFVIATANNTDAIPDSLLRLGRFDKKIRVNEPELKYASEIIKYYLSKKSFVADIDYKEVARILDGHSCADLETVINEAGIYAGFDNREKIEMNDIVRSAMRVIFCAPESIDEKSPEVLLKTAYHEAGHAVIAEMLEPDSVSIVSILTHEGNIGGVTAYNRDENYWVDRKFMENRVISLLGGKASTELVYGEVDVGANMDLHRAFDIVERFTDDYCSNSFDRWEQGRNVSDDLVSRREMQMSIELENYYWKAKKILAENREFLDKLAHLLVEKKTVLSKDIKELKLSCAKN